MSAETTGVVLQCSRHPSREAHITCERCGDFACGDCIGATGRYCVQCRPTHHEDLRRRFLPTERSVKSLGTLFLLIGLMTAFLAWLVGAGTMRFSVEPIGSVDVSGNAGLTCALGGASAVFAIVGWGLRALKGWARAPAAILLIGLLIVGLFSFVLSPLFAIVACAVSGSRLSFLSESGVGRVLSRDYAAAVRATPELSLRSKFWMAVLALFLMFVVCVIAVGAAVIMAS
jgi:hypothetical protein